MTLNSRVFWGGIGIFGLIQKYLGYNAKYGLILSVPSNETSGSSSRSQAGKQVLFAVLFRRPISIILLRNSSCELLVASHKGLSRSAVDVPAEKVEGTYTFLEFIS